MEDYLRNGDTYSRRQLTLLRYGGQQLRVSRGRYEGKLETEPEFFTCPLCKLSGLEVVEDERHIVCECPCYKEERKVLVEQLTRVKLDVKRHPSWDHVQSSEAFFCIVMGALPMPSTLRQRKMARLYCRQFLASAMRRRERQLASLPKLQRRGGSQVDRRDPVVEVDELVGAVVEVKAVERDKLVDEDAVPANGHADIEWQC
jgi:hypothetical protein